MQITEGVETPTIESLMRALLAFTKAGAPLSTPVKVLAHRNREAAGFVVEFGTLLPEMSSSEIEVDAATALAAEERARSRAKKADDSAATD